MRRIIIVPLSTLILLCLLVLAIKSSEVQTGRCYAYTIRSLIRPGRPAPAGFVSLPAQTNTAPLQEIDSLQPGKPVERELTGGQSHSFEIAMNADQYSQIVVEQRGIDVAVALFAPDGRKISEVDRERVREGSETILAITEVAGAYKVEVRAPEKGAKTGIYRIQVEELRAAAAEDKYRVSAWNFFRDAEQIQNGTGEMRRESIKKYEAARELYRKASDLGGEAQTLTALSHVYWSFGNLTKVLEISNEALSISRSVGDRRSEAVALNNIGAVYGASGESQLALEKYNEALPIRRALGDRSGEAQLLSNIGAVYRNSGELQKALEMFKQALTIRGEMRDRRGEANTLTSMGIVYELSAEMPKALEMYQQAVPLWRALGDRRGEGISLNQIAKVYSASGEQQKALEIFDELLPIIRTMGDRRSEGALLLNIGQVYKLLGEMQKALEMFNQALPLLKVTGGRQPEAITLNAIAGVYLSKGELGKALEIFHQALTISQAITARNDEAVILRNIALTEQKRGNLVQARQFIEEAIKIVESVRAGLDSEELRASFFASKQQFYESYLNILMEMHRQTPSASFAGSALAASERARARLLLELLAEARADIRQGVDSALLVRERALRQQLAVRAAVQTKLLNDRHTPEQAEAVAKEVATLTTQYDELETQIRASSPRYADLTQPQPLNLSEIQQQILDPETLLLEYSLGTDASYLFLVSQTSISSRQLPERSEIEKAGRRVYDLLTAQQPKHGETAAELQARIADAKKNYWPQAALLSKMLLGPVASQLGKKRLLIVADGALRIIPFAALPVPSAADDGDGDPQPLLIDHEIVSIPSASTLATLRNEIAGRKPAEKALAVLADPVFADDDVRVSRQAKIKGFDRKAWPADSGEEDLASLQLIRSARETGATSGEARFSRLLSTRREAAAILALVPERERKQALDFQASRASALSPDLARYRIVHFATHGLLNNLHPALSGIVLSLVDEKGNPQDGFLRLQDIYNLKLPAELVVLSACQTGLGKEIKGEGLIGLTRGFMYAGTPRVVASLWKVDDRATSELMKHFYQGMLGPERLRPAAALRQAQLSIWHENQWRAPYYWAAFLLQGEWK